MTNFIKRITENERFILIRSKTAEFLNGRLYPLLVALFVLIGHVTALEFYFNIPIIISVCLGLFISPTLKPFLIVLTTFIYQIPFKHTPADFTYPYVPDRDYYATPFILAGIIILGIAVLIALIYRFVRYSARNINQDTPLIMPVTLISLAFLFNGVFGGSYTVANLFYALSQIAVYFFLFYLLYFGLRDVKKEELISYVSYIALLNSMVLLGELAFVYLTYDNIFVNGSLVKEAVNLGWAVGNPAGFLITSFIPMICLGAVNGKHPVPWLLATCATWLGAVATLSRNAMLFSTLTVIVCLIYGSLKGRNLRIFRIVSAVVAVACVIVVIIFHDKLFSVFKNLIDMGLDDHGRFDLWRRAVELFGKAPIFGVGFFGFGDIGTSTFIPILPTMAHNTLLVLLSSMGLFGFVTFIWYRVKLLSPLTKNRTHETNMLLISFLSIIAMSLLDNFVFYIYTMFYYMILQCTAIIVKEDTASSLRTSTDGQNAPATQDASDCA